VNKKVQYLKNNNSINKILFFFFSIYPITFLFGNFLINLFLFIINFIFILGLIKNSFSYKILDKSVLYLLFFLFFSFLINLIFSNNYLLSFPRVLKFILIIGLIISFRQLLISFKKSEIDKLFKIWSIIFIVVMFDIVFELTFKSNILGLKSFMPSRVASFAGDELNIGHFFSAFCLIFIAYIKTTYRNIFLNFLIAIFLIVISFLIGERSNFIRTFLIISTFIILYFEIKLKFKIISLSSIIIFFIIFLNFNSEYKLRYFSQFTNILSKNGISYYFDNSVYGAHYNVAKEIFKDNKIFGAGIKNFRTESYDKKYDDLDHKLNDRRANTHPHQIHYEFLSETGLFGYLSFTIFICFSFYLVIKNSIKNKNYYQLAAFFYVAVSLLPLLPSGSFFSTYGSGLFWLNYAIMVGYLKNKT
jgi:O-antigen ligase